MLETFFFHKEKKKDFLVEKLYNHKYRHYSAKILVLNYP